MVVEGIVISKIPYKERDLIVKLILRNGFVGSFYVYGGQGGGKHQKPASFDVGLMMRVQIKKKSSYRQTNSELFIAEESTAIWTPKFLRHNIQAFYLMCFYFELIQKFALNFDVENFKESIEQEGFFSVVSNALFYMDHAISRNDFIYEQHAFIFFVKTLYHLGIIPELDFCSFCNKNLETFHRISLVFQNGQFACSECVTGENDKSLLLKLKKAYQTKFQDYSTINNVGIAEIDKLMKYFCHHYNLKPIELKSYSLLFKG